MITERDTDTVKKSDYLEIQTAQLVRIADALERIADFVERIKLPKWLR
jgi:hypothetical protein